MKAELKQSIVGIAMMIGIAMLFPNKAAAALDFGGGGIFTISTTTTDGVEVFLACNGEAITAQTVSSPDCLWEVKPGTVADTYTFKSVKHVVYLSIGNNGTIGISGPEATQTTLTVTYDRIYRNQGQDYFLYYNAPSWVSEGTKNNTGGSSLDSKIISSSLELTASCVHCPIQAKLTDAVDITNYKLYCKMAAGDTVPIGPFTAETTSFPLLKEDGSLLEGITTISDGQLTFYARHDSISILLSPEVIVNIYPQSATWTGTTNSKTWKEAANWTSQTGGYPIWCTDVLIPENKSSYPVLGLSATQDSCRDITFEPGASVAGVHKLHYRRAFVQFRPDRNRWYTLAAPLKYMYSADYSFTDNESYSKANNTYGISPKVFMMYFDQKSPDATHSLDGEKGTFTIGSFSKPFTRLEEPLGNGQAFALWVNGSPDYPDAAFPSGSSYQFPRLASDGSDLQYFYHDWDTGKMSSEAETLGRGSDADRYRFSFEDLKNGSLITLPLHGGETSGSTRMVGNPTMSYLDFSVISKQNSGIQPYYRIWDGEKYYTNPTPGGTWEGMSEQEWGTAGTTTSNYIAPMQAFFVEVTGTGTQTLSVDLDQVCVDPGTYPGLKSSAASSADFLRLSLVMNGVATTAVVAVNESYSGEYRQGEDIFKLFSPNEIPEIYTMTNDRVATEFNLMPLLASQRIPVGISMAGKGSGVLTVGNLDAFDRYEEVYLYDSQSDKRYNLRLNPELAIEKNSEQESLTGRFFLELNRVANGIVPASVEENDILYVCNKDNVTIYSNTSTLQSVEVMDLSGQRIRKEENSGTSCLIPTASFTKGIYLIRAISGAQTRTVKLTF